MEITSPKIVFLDANTLTQDGINLDGLIALGELKVYPYTSEEKLVERSLDADIIISNKVKIQAPHIDQLPKLKMIQVAATGYNNIDITAAKKAGITVCNVSGYSTSAVVQHVFAMLFSYLNNCESYFQESASAAWSQKTDFSYWNKPIEEIAGKTIGVIGLGKIGSAVAKVAAAHGMRVIAPHSSSQENKSPDAERVDLDRVYSESDIISIHVPLNEKTKHLINKETLSMMKSTAILINTARGEIIQDTDLAQALESGVIQAALIDVLAQEPPPSDHILLHVKNCYVTPHQAWASVQARQRLVDGMVENIKGFLSGMPQNLVG